MKMERVRIPVGKKLILQLEPEQHLLFVKRWEIFKFYWFSLSVKGSEIKNSK